VGIRWTRREYIPVGSTLAIRASDGPANPHHPLSLALYTLLGSFDERTHRR